MGYKVVVMGDFNAHTARGDEAPKLEAAEPSIRWDMLIANELSVCNRRWM